jgi:hypothetical protein
MRILTTRTLIAAATIALLAVTAQAQGVGKGNRQATDPKKTENLAKKKADEKAYKDALEKIPESKEKPDPWKTMR